MKAKTRKHQDDALKKAYPVLKRDGFFGLFMDMGTGKTITTMFLVEKLAKDGLVDCFVIVVPNIGVDTWIEQIPQHGDFPAAPLAWDGQKAATAKYAKMFDGILDKMPIYIVNVEAFQGDNKFLKKNLDELFKKKVFLCLDESSVIKNPTALRTKNLLKVAEKAKFRTILTGTEISGHICDIYSQFEFLEKGFWAKRVGIRSAYIFKCVFEVVIKKRRNDGMQYDEILKYDDMSHNQKMIYDNNLKQVNYIINPYVYRIRKEECYDLPPKIYTQLNFDLSREERRIYNEMKKDLIANIGEDEFLAAPNQAVAFLRARMITGGWITKDGQIEEMPSKVKAMLAHIELHDKQAIIGCSFTHEVEYISKVLEKYGKVSKFYGANVNTRDNDKKDFISGDSRFFVCNISAASKSLNLQHCSLVYRYTRGLSPIDESQFEDRVYRDGQTKSPQYIDLMANDSIDKRVGNIISGNVNLREKFQALGKRGFVNEIF